MSLPELSNKDEQLRPCILRIAGLDRSIHDPSRLELLVALLGYEPAALSYGALQQLTGLSRGNISGHLPKLECAGLVAVERRFYGEWPQAWVSLTRVGAEKVVGHLGELWEIRGSLEAIERGMPV